MTLDPKKLGRYATDPAAFRADLSIEVGGNLVPLGERLDHWQNADFRAADNGWRRAIGHKVEAIGRYYYERPRGHSKTQDTAVSATWALAFAPRQLLGIAAAADADQGRLLADAVSRLLHTNPMLAGILEVQRNTIVNTRTKSELRIISSDVGSSYGALVDFIVIDELTHWTAAGEGLWHSLLSTAAKKPTCLLTIISNAGLGMGESWQWKVREAARLSPSWRFSRLDGPVASWILPQLLQEQRELLPPGPFKRLWLNEWCASQGDALSDEDIAAALTEDGPLDGPHHEYTFVGGLDLSVRRDRSSLVVIGCHGPTKSIRIAGVWSWKPVGGQVDFMDIEQTILAAHRRFHLHSLCFDPFQAALLTQRLARQGLRTVEVPFVGKNLNTMASTLLQFFRERRISLYDGVLVKDLRKLVIVERQFGLKLEAPSGADGHADCAFALACALPTCAQTLRSWSPRVAELPWTGVCSNPFRFDPSRYLPTSFS